MLSFLLKNVILRGKNENIKNKILKWIAQLDNSGMPISRETVKSVIQEMKTLVEFDKESSNVYEDVRDK